jgi:hypothetical protein
MVSTLAKAATPKEPGYTPSTPELKRESYAQNKIEGPICGKTKFFRAFINKTRG